MTLPATATDVATFLAAAGHGTVGTDIFNVPEQPESNIFPAAAVFCVLYAGDQDDYVGQTPQGIYKPKVQVTVRGAQQAAAWATGEAKARAVRDALHAVALGGSYIDCRTLNGPNFIGKNDQDQPRWTINVAIQAAV